MIINRNTRIKLTAIPDEGYQFNGWNNGETENPFITTVNEIINYNNELRALFSLIAGSDSGSGEDEEQENPFEGQICPENEIWYITQNEEIADLFIDRTYPVLCDLNVISNVYENGKGIVTFSENIDHVSYRLFECNIYTPNNNNNLLHIKLPNSVTKICDSAFMYCNKLKSINLDNISIIEENAFWGCESLTSVNLLNIVSLGEYAFNNSGINDIHINNSLTTLPEGCFEGTKISTLSWLPSSITRFPKYCFAHCYNLIDINIPNTVVSMDVGCFLRCDNLINVNIPNSVRTISGYAFSSCENIISIYVPTSVTNIGEKAFSKVNNIIYYGNAYNDTVEAKTINGIIENGFIYKDTEKTILSAYVGDDTEVNIPEGVITISSNLFSLKNKTNVTSVVIPDSVITIKSEAFKNCTGLLSVSIPNSVTTIEPDAFYGCTNLTNINLSSSMTILHANVFYGCTSLTNINIPNSVTKIYGSTFKGCNSLTYIEIPNSVRTIGTEAFADCISLRNVILSNTVSCLSYGIFNGCLCLENINIPNSVTTIEKLAFNKCYKLKNLVIPDSVSTIGDNALGGGIYSALGVNHIEYHGTATGAPWGALSMNGYIENNIVYENSSKSVIISYIGSDAHLDIPHGVNCINEKAFILSLASSYTIPNTVTTIESYAFGGGDYASSYPEIIPIIENLVIPNSVIDIGSNAFINVQHIEYHGTATGAPWGALSMN